MSDSRTFAGLPGLRWNTFLLAALSLSIGWGIRGNFGHEYGAMIPGALTAIAVCMMSGRADWRARVPYFGMFGALGWAFGGSISYMQVIAHTHSGHAPTQYYGFFCLFLIGFLWGGMGGAGTAFPAVADRKRLTAIFRPLCWVFGVWLVLNLAALPMIERWESGYAQTWHRHESPLYWFDADWIQALTAILAVCLFDLWDRKFSCRHVKLEVSLLIVALAFCVLIMAVPINAQVTAFLCGLAVLAMAAAVLYPALALYGVVGAAGGFVVRLLFDVTGVSWLIAKVLVQYQGDVDKAREFAAAQGIPLQEALSGYLINWPQFFSSHPEHLGWMLGLLLALGVYFARHGKFRSGSSLFLYMGLGWFAGFLLFPTLLGFGGAGFRMTPPRGDDWAGILGVFVATMLWAYRQNLPGVLFAGLLSGTVGGLGFSGAAFIKLLMVAPGNPALVSDPAVIEAWQHWQSANWHSFLEQTYGFINGLGIALTLGLLATRQGAVEDEPGLRRWTEVFAAAFVLFGVTFLNIFKNVPHWIEAKTVPAVMKMPLFGAVEMPAAAWFLLVWGLMTAMGIYLMQRHLRQPLAAMPDSWLGKGQLFYLVFLWMIVVANFERALPGFSAGRILTEGTIFVNAIVVTGMILVWPRQDLRVPLIGLHDYQRTLSWTLLGGLAAVLIATLGMTQGIRCVYGESFAGHSSIHKRFGPDATWRIAPLQKGAEHS